MTRRPILAPGFRRRVAYALNLIVFLLAVATVAVVVNYFAQRSELRWRLDATKTRAYSLSPQTAELLRDLEGAWTIALVMIADETSAAVRAQVREVLDRYREATPAISVTTVDPTDPRAIGDYETLLARLRSLEASRIEAYEVALRDGVRGFERLQLFAQQQSGQLEQALPHVAADDPARAALEQRLGLLGLLADEGGQVLDAVAAAREVGDAQPLPDYETARSILAQALTQWSDELLAMTGVYEQWQAADGVNPVLAAFAGRVEDAYRSLAQDLAVIADPLTRLPPLELASIGRQLETGEVAIVIGPEAAAVIPSRQLFPKLNLRALGGGAVAFDRRFRGEQVISAAIRSLRGGVMPMVVFVHAEERSLLRENDTHTDVVGVASTLRASRFDVKEWSVTQTEQPLPAAEQPVVWVIIPPAQRAGLEPDRAELALIRAADRLITDGAAVCLNVFPSLLPRYRQPDPWARLSAPFDLVPDTGHAIFDAVSETDGSQRAQAGVTILDVDHDHPIARAVDGQPTYIPLPVAITTPGGTTPTSVVLSVDPDGRRWREADWAGVMRNPATPVTAEPLSEPVPVVVATERTGPDGPQRFVLAGSGGWLHSSIADVLLPLGGGRAALQHPGNQELMLAIVAWLAERDELIAPSPVSRQVARLSGLDRSGQIGWALLAVIGLPFVSLVSGAGVWFLRRGGA
ncbi:MAG: hypothetical protein HKO59_06465 [Phycisphaerales bacterium]|nr:GldG family protein [Phycisphaerae bacterium]NNF44339.1 hypothetical protein [Phycisphaerales bacterium]NNM25618.1 hypothetical protein [Phycisphaerales bacterium]